MDDFLHNLRSGKLKQPDRGRRDYSDYKGPQRRVSNERRRPDYYAKVTSENFALIKESMDKLADNQKRIIDAAAVREKTDSRIADALETIADVMRRREDRAPHHETVDNKDPVETITPALSPVETITPTPSAEVEVKPRARAGNQREKLSDRDKPRMLKTIASMRADNKSWEKVARQMDDLGIPTVSGKGKWRGPAIKKFWDANS